MSAPKRSRAAAAPAGPETPAAAQPELNKAPVPETPTAPAPAAQAEETSKGEIEVKYRDHVGETVSRVFSKEVHGPDFKKLAAQFVETNKARIVA